MAFEGGTGGPAVEHSAKDVNSPCQSVEVPLPIHLTPCMTVRLLLVLGVCLCGKRCSLLSKTPMGGKGAGETLGGKEGQGFVSILFAQVVAGLHTSCHEPYQP